MRSEGFSLLELLFVVALVALAAVLVLRPGGRLSASEQAFVDQVAALVAQAGQEAFLGHVEADVVQAGGKVVLRLGGQVLEEVSVPASVRPPSGTLVAYAPGGKLVRGGVVVLSGRTGTWRLVAGEAGTVHKEVDQ